MIKHYSLMDFLILILLELALLVDGPARNILVELAMIYIENSCDSDVWISSCPKCNILKQTNLWKLVFAAANCFVANKVKN